MVYYVSLTSKHDRATFQSCFIGAAMTQTSTDVLFEAVNNNSAYTLQKCLEDISIDINTTNKERLTLLQKAS